VETSICTPFSCEVAEVYYSAFVSEHIIKLAY
jgi:hypothetical protein